eukprot:g29979.t1
MVESVKFLTVVITNNLSWSTHVDTPVKKAQQHLYFFRRLRKFGTLNDAASTALSSNEFHRVTTLWLKKFLLISVLKGYPFTLRLCHCILFSLPSTNIHSFRASKYS